MKQNILSLGFNTNSIKENTDIKEVGRLAFDKDRIKEIVKWIN